ncbi:MAG TPA: hypothetical protein VN923_04950, partial [Thermoanaerobaculia bacterium]|nr:hypothetical protein [Thermoanaerobaculia bacterium]
ELASLRWAAAVAAAVAAGMAFAALRAARVPIFQAPDEDTHFDYVISVATAGRPLFAGERPVAELTGQSPFAPYSHPYTWHLALHTRTFDIRFHPERKAPRGYGSREFFDAVERTAPVLHGLPPRLPWLVTRYPLGYYGLAGLWTALWGKVFPGVVAAFFLARSFSIVLLGVGLVAGYGVLRALRCPRGVALGLIAALGCFPLSSFVGSYVQSDNLGFAAAPLALWAALRLRRQPAVEASRGQLLLAGATLALLLLSKYHVFLTVGLPILAMLAVHHAATSGRARADVRKTRKDVRKTRKDVKKTRKDVKKKRRHGVAGAAPWRSWARWTLLLLGPPLLALGLQLVVEAGRPEWTGTTEGISKTKGILAQPVGDRAGYAVRASLVALSEFFSDRAPSSPGGPFKTFWYAFGWADMKLAIVSPAVQRAIVQVVQLVTVSLLVLILVRLGQAWAAIVRAWRSGRRGRALRLLTGNPLLNAYLLYVGVMVVLFVLLGKKFGFQGRHWFTVLLAIFWAGVCFAPRCLPSRRWSRRVTGALLGMALAYSLVGGFWSLRAIDDRYYSGAGDSDDDRTTTEDLHAFVAARK